MRFDILAFESEMQSAQNMGCAFEIQTRRIIASNELTGI